jgi:hypothetical protein
MLKIVRTFEIFFALLPIKYLMKLFFFSDLFSNTVALPMVALFLGTGNYTTEVPSMIMERLCTSPTYGMWYPPDKNSIASNMPPMVVFPNFSNFYEDWKKSLEKKGVKVRLSTELVKVVQRDNNGVIVLTKPTIARDREDLESDSDAKESREEYDELVMCVL